MSKKHLIISTSTELVRFVPDKIAYIKAEGNYCEIFQVDNKTRVLILQLGKIGDAIDKQLGVDENPFARIGKSIIINCNYVYSINVPKKELILSDMATFYYSLDSPEKGLKELKKHFDLVDKEEEHGKESDDIGDDEIQFFGNDDENQDFGSEDSRWGHKSRVLIRHFAAPSLSRVEFLFPSIILIIMLLALLLMMLFDH